MTNYVLVGVVLYLLAGIVAVLTPPLAKETRTPFWRFRAEILGIPVYRAFLAEATIHIVVVLGWPVFYVIVFLDARRGRQISTKIADELPNKEEGLYFDSTGGAGAIRCNACGHEQGITSFLHSGSSPEDGWCESGFQCQSCGSFQTISNAVLTTEERCACGGELSRDKVIFCPKCKSRDVRYLMGIIT